MWPDHFSMCRLAHPTVQKGKSNLNGNFFSPVPDPAVLIGDYQLPTATVKVSEALQNLLQPSVKKFAAVPSEIARGDHRFSRRANGSG
jgi:hypothetical protein